MGGYMPIIDGLNDISSRLRKIEGAVLGWEEVALAVGLLDAIDDDMRALIALWPSEIRDVVAALVVSAASSGARLRFLWKPGYDFDVSISKVNADRDGQAEYAVVLTSEYPERVMRRT